MKLNARELPHVVVGAVMEVHRQLGAGWPLEAYKACLGRELRMREILFVQDAPGRIEYKGREIPVRFTMDFLIENLVVVHCYCADDLTAFHKQKLKNHLRMTGIETGFLVNFQALDLRKGGVKRLIVSSEEPEVRWKAYEEEVAEEGESAPEGV